MKKILGLTLIVILSLICLSGVHAATYNSLGNESISPTIGTVNSGTNYEIEMTWGSMSFNYNKVSVNNDGTHVYAWTGESPINILNSSNDLIDVSFSWSAQIDGTGAILGYTGVECVEADEPSQSNFESLNRNVGPFSDSSCTTRAEEYVNNTPYYYYEIVATPWYVSHPLNTLIYDQYGTRTVTSDTVLSGRTFRLNGGTLVSNDGTVLGIPSVEEPVGFFRFNLMLGDTQSSRSLETLHSGDTIGTLTVTFSAAE